MACSLSTFPKCSHRVAVMTSMASTKATPTAGPSPSPLVPPIVTTEASRSLLANKLRASSPPGTTTTSSKLSQPQSQSQSQQQPAQQPQPPLPHYAPPTPIPSTSSTPFELPRKRIISPKSLQRFQDSSAFSDIMGLTMALNESVKGKKLTDDVHESETTKAIISILSEVSDLVDKTPATDNSASRFGNPAFRDLYRAINSQSRSFHDKIPGLKERASGSEHVDAISEVKVYFDECWGNEERIDYGSGMELNFLCWILCFVRLSLLDIKSDGPAIVLRIFWQYIQVMRKIQSTYWLEPAGSHGVWGLDDYHFLPFIFGSSQLSSHRHLRPKSIHDAEILEEFSKDYMYLACINFINSIKTASLRWHSPMLDDISSVKTWSKVNEGMLKMYKAEVLSKLPIAQHIFFGSLLEFPATKPGEEEEEEGGAVDACGHGHIHSHGPSPAAPDGAGSVAPDGQAAGWGDCCGIPIPSVFAAAQEESKNKEQFRVGAGVRRVPFD